MRQNSDCINLHLVVTHGPSNLMILKLLSHAIEVTGDRG